MPPGSLVAGAALLAICASAQQEPQLSPAQSAIINRKIAALRTTGERSIAQSWSNSKKVGEMLCRPAALSALKKKDPTIDKVLLGTADPPTLALETNKRLTGGGQYRTGYNWISFTFTCDLDPKTGKVTGFQIAPIS